MVGIQSLVIYEKMLIKANKSLNLVGKSTINNIWIRHFLDSSQVIDFIDKNDKTLIDIGSGAGFPGLVIAILAKERRLSLKIKLIDKSPNKTKFLKSLIKELRLNTDVVCQNILEKKQKMNQDIIIARAFKPLSKILEIIHEKGENWKKIFLFLGKSGKNELHEASKNWDIQYKQRVSITSSDSIVIEINRLKKIE